MSGKGGCRVTQEMRGTIRSQQEFFIDNLLVRVHFFIDRIWWTDLAPWEFEFPFPCSLIPTFLDHQVHSTLPRNQIRFKARYVHSYVRVCV